MEQGLHDKPEVSGIAWNNAEHTSVAATVDGKRLASIPKGHRLWDLVMEAINSGGKASPFVDTSPTPEELGARRRDAERQAVAMTAMSIVAPVIANAMELPDSALAELADAVPDYFDDWKAGTAYTAGNRLWHGDALYVVMQGVTAQAHQPPGAVGMLAIYRPVNASPSADGTLERPIPFVYGMDTDKGKFYSFEGGVWESLLDGRPCVWNPGPDLPTVWRLWKGEGQ